MSTQKALILPGKHGKWTIGENSIPTPGPKDVLVKIMSAALNPIEWKIQAFGMFIKDFPFIPGSDGAGIVEAGNFDRQHATFQQYCIVAAEHAAKIPSNISFDQAASIPLTLATVFTGIWNHDPKVNMTTLPAPWEEGGVTQFAGKPAFIMGGASSVGQYAIQLARMNKFSPIIATASLKHESFLKSLGATHILDRSLSPDAILAEVPMITGGAPVEYVYNAISSPDTQILAYDVLAPGGLLILVQEERIPAEKKKAEDKKRIIKVFGSVHLPENRQVGLEVYSRLTEWLEQGVLVPNLVEVLPNGLAGIPDGLERLKQNKVSGTKLIARPQETP